LDESIPSRAAKSIRHLRASTPASSPATVETIAGRCKPWLRDAHGVLDIFTFWNTSLKPEKFFTQIPWRARLGAMKVEQFCWSEVGVGSKNFVFETLRH